MHCTYLEFRLFSSTITLTEAFDGIPLARIAGAFNSALCPFVLRELITAFKYYITL